MRIFSGLPFTVLPVALCCMFPFVSFGDDGSGREVVPILLAEDIASWRVQSFEGDTDYKFVEDEDTNTVALHAECNGTASALYRKISVDLTRTPILQWDWKIDAVHPGLDDTSKAGDDYAARVYVVHKGMLPWSVRAVNYVWANTSQKGAQWPNAFDARAMMIALKSGTPATPDEWISEQRNVLHDFSEYHGMDIGKISGVAIMTDCDNGGGIASAEYRNIRFTQ